jgi:hypothetical protein
MKDHILGFLLAVCFCVLFFGAIHVANAIQKI